LPADDGRFVLNLADLGWERVGGDRVRRSAGGHAEFVAARRPT
jgi:hypothetical protein